MIYLVEDDGNIREFVLYALTGQGYDAPGALKSPRSFSPRWSGSCRSWCCWT